MNPKVSLEFISCGCSKTPHSLDWGKNNWIAFGSSHNVGLIHPEDEKTAPFIAGTYCSHKGNVTVVRFVRSSSETSYVVSGSTDGSTVLWRQDDRQLEPLVKLCGHSMSVNYACGIFNEEDKSIVIVTCSADSTLRIWRVNPSSIENFELSECCQTVTFGTGFALCADSCHLTQNDVLLAVGNDDNKIRLFYQENSAKLFSQKLIVSGHEDWIRGLHFSKNSECIYLASCSQDSYVRLWKISPTNVQSNCVNGAVECAEDIKVRGRSFEIEKGGQIFGNFEVTLNAILAGHESWVYSVDWNHSGKRQILTSSMDKSLIIWEEDVSVGIWFAKVHLGEVGGPVAGFYGAKFSPDGRSVVAHSFLGGLHRWRLDEKEVWNPAVIPTGHFDSVEDIMWEPNGNYLMSCSQDQTTRLFSCWRRPKKNVTYHEVARPQVHGHDLQCLSIVSSFCFVSGAEEKIIRAFVAPRSFAKNLEHIASLDHKTVEQYLPLDQLAEGASVPALGLSNKAVFEGDVQKVANAIDSDESAEKYPVFYFHPVDLLEPPTEDYLAQNTLWPEVHKLYGHGFEIFSVASNPSGTIVASACKASKSEHARVILWSTNDWQQKCQLDGASLTVTEIAFSSNDKFLLVVSRDRTWYLYKRGNGDFEWNKVGFSDKKTCVHSRLIWSCSWTHDSEYFATVSRDKKVAMWKIADSVSSSSLGIVTQCGKSLDTADSTTAVAIAPKFADIDCYLLAYGLESGKITLCLWNRISTEFSLLQNISETLGHALTVKRLRFHPSCEQTMKGENNTGNDFLLASCSMDHTVKIFRISLDSK